MTYQTKQLTTEFEKQSRYIVCLLAELQQKDGALLSLEEELQRCKQEFELFKSQREEEEKSIAFEGDGQQKEMGREESSLETFGLHSRDEKQQAVTCDPDRPTVGDNGKSRSGEQDPKSIESDVTQRSHDGAEVELSQDGATADIAAALPALQHQLLQEISGSNPPVDDSQGMHTENKLQEGKCQHQDRPQNQSSITAALPCWAEPRSPTGPHDNAAAEELQIESSCDKEQRGLEREDEGIEGGIKAASEPEINRLEEQVCNLFRLCESLPRPGHAFLLYSQNLACSISSYCTARICFIVVCVKSTF